MKITFKATKICHNVKDYLVQNFHCDEDYVAKCPCPLKRSKVLFTVGVKDI